MLRGYQPFPQLIRNVRVREKSPLEAIPSVAKAITECCLVLGESGRVVVRYSGTEPLARVMVEGADALAVEEHTTRIAAAIESALGRQGIESLGIGSLVIERFSDFAIEYMSITIDDSPIANLPKTQWPDDPMA